VKHPLWSATYEMFKDVETLLSEPHRLAPAVEAPEAAPPAASRAVSVKKTTEFRVAGVMPAFDPTGDLVEARATVRAKLDILKASLSAQLTDRETYLVLFPIVVFCDEMVQNRYLATKGMAWPPLQKELFAIDDGGELFYETLDDLLRKPETLPFVYEVYYFCLGYGFGGKYADNLAKINQYRSKLGEKIPLPAVERAAEKGGAPDLVGPPRFPYWYYAAALVAVAGAYFALRAAAWVV